MEKLGFLGFASSNTNHEKCHVIFITRQFAVECICWMKIEHTKNGKIRIERLDGDKEKSMSEQIFSSDVF